MERGETLEQALRRELREEIGVEISKIQPALFKDRTLDKTFEDGRVQPVYMIFLLFHCTTREPVLKLNEEFVDYRWVRETELAGLGLNAETVDTFDRLGPWREIRYLETDLGRE